MFVVRHSRLPVVFRPTRESASSGGVEVTDSLRAATALRELIRKWSESDAGYDRACDLLCESLSVFDALIAEVERLQAVLVDEHNLRRTLSARAEQAEAERDGERDQREAMRQAWLKDRAERDRLQTQLDAATETMLAHDRNADEITVGRERLKAALEQIVMTAFRKANTDGSIQPRDWAQQMVPTELIEAAEGALGLSHGVPQDQREAK